MDKKLLETLAERLRQEREEYLAEFRRAEEGLEAIAQERESEIEEHGQEEQSARVLRRLDDRTLHAIQEIDAALAKMLKSNYGRCESCKRMISRRRLEALPAARYCKNCSARNEKPTPIPVTMREIAPSAAVSQDANLLDDSDLTQLIRDHLRKDGRIDTEELRIYCRNGAVHLSGALPSEPEHQILVQIVTDVLGFREVVDRIQIEELDWQRESRTREKPPEVLPPGQEPPGTEDIAESYEEDKDFIAPGEPIPNEE
jgi:RNA polymerase-binding transcription factor DksA